MKRPRLLNKLNGLARFVPDLLGGDGGCSGGAPVSEEPSLASGGPQVLIIDDDEVILAATSMRLRKAGCSVAVARDGSEAIAAIGRQSPEVILLDINFPPDVSNGGLVSWDGFRIMFWLRGLENAHDARFIITTGDPYPGCSERALAAGAIGFLPKPIDQTKLIKLITGKLQPEAKLPL